MSASAGNSGPGPATTEHVSPWVITVAASTQTRTFQSTLTVTSGADSATFDSKVWPTELLPTIRVYEPKSPGDPANIFNDYTDGGFLIYFAPKYKVFVDDRCEVFGDDWLEEFVRAGETGAGTSAAMERWQTKYGNFAFALTRTDSEFDKYFRARDFEWELKRATPTANFYRRLRP